MDSLLENLKRILGAPFNRVKQLIFGRNNEKLDFLMDSFYKLSPQQQSFVLVGGGAFIATFLIVAVSLYFTAVSGLERDLNRGFAALHELKSKNEEYQQINAAFDKLSKSIRNKTSGINLGFFENLAEQQGVEIISPKESEVAMDAENSLTNSFSYLDVEFEIKRVSIPKLLNFLTEIEKAGKFFRVRKLHIDSIYGEKGLYFNVKTKIRGYKTTS